jgi:hypothetical protein
MSPWLLALLRQIAEREKSQPTDPYVLALLRENARRQRLH